MQTAEERERSLWIASQQYVNEDINIDELEEIERIQSENLRNAIIAISQRSVKREIINKLYKVLVHRNRNPSVV